MVEIMVQYVDASNRSLFYDDDGGVTPLVKRKLRVCVHDDGVTYKGTVTDIIVVDESKEVWLQCKFDKTKDKRVGECVLLTFIWLRFIN